MTTVHRVDAERPAGPGLDAAAAVLNAGGTVALPTEASTGWARTLSIPRRWRVCSASRAGPESKPVLVLVDSVERALSLVASAGPDVRGLMARHLAGAAHLVAAGGADWRPRPSLPPARARWACASPAAR